MHSALRNLPKEAQDARRARIGMSPAVPQDYSGRDLTGELLSAASLATAPVPVLGDLTGLAADARMYQMRPEERTMGNYAMSALGVLPFVPSVAATKAAVRAADAVKELAKRGYDPANIRNAYPVTGAGQLNFSNPEKPEGFMQKVQTPEEKALNKARTAAQKDINAGNYTPYFNEADRYYADPSSYNLQGNTLVDAMPAMQKTIDQYKGRFDTPEVRATLNAAYDKAISPDSVDWYAMGQLQDAFVKELGVDEGLLQFKNRFADAMAATTGGADPTANLLTSAYANFQKQAGQDIPVGSYNIPHPLGGRYQAGNLDMARKIMLGNIPLTTIGQPKRFNFSANMLGDMSRGTIDEQMSGGFEKGLTAPPGASYGIMEGVVGDIAKERGLQTGNFQDVVWAGLKGVSGKPMIRHVNEALERTARVTGGTPEDALRGFIRGTAPLYGVAGTALGLSALRNINQDSEQMP